MFLIFAMSLLAAPAPATLAGLYEVEQMEMAGGLELKADGRFRYLLSYGAADEQGEGDWSFDGKTVRLTSNPMPELPSFELVGDDPAPAGQLAMTLEDPGFGAQFSLDAIATTAKGEKLLVSADEDGSVETPAGTVVERLEPLVPVYGQSGGSFPLARGRGHRLRFRFHANDLGKVAFDGQPLEIRGAELEMRRYDATIRFIRVEP